MDDPNKIINKETENIFKRTKQIWKLMNIVIELKISIESFNNITRRMIQWTPKQIVWNYPVRSSKRKEWASAKTAQGTLRYHQENKYMHYGRRKEGGHKDSI